MFGWFAKRGRKRPYLNLDPADQLIVDEYVNSQNAWLKLYALARQHSGNLSSHAYVEADSSIAYDRYKRAEEAYEDLKKRLVARARAALQSSPDGMGEDELGSNTDKLQRKEF